MTKDTTIPVNSNLIALKKQCSKYDGYDTGLSIQGAISDVGEKVREMRKYKSLSQKELAELSGMSQAEISRIEAGLGINGPTVGTLQRLVIACGGTGYSLAFDILDNAPHGIISPEAKNTINDPLQYKILQLLSQGYSNPDICDELKISKEVLVSSLAEIRKRSEELEDGESDPGIRGTS